MISVIIPAYNAENTIEKCLKSVINQTYHDLEIIIVDDGSIDRTSEIANSLAVKDSRISVLHQKNSGVSVARNKGLYKSKGEYVFFVDADDYLDVNALSVLAKDQEETNADIVACIISDEKGTASSLSVFNRHNDFFADDNKSIGENMIYLRLGSVIGKLFKKAIIIENNIIFQNELEIGEDLIFSHTYLIHCQSIMKDSKSIYFVRNVNTESLSKKFAPNCEMSTSKRIDAIKKTFSFFPEYKKKWNESFAGINLFEYLCFIQNLFLKGNPYTNIERYHLIKDYFNRNNCCQEIKQALPEEYPKNWTEKIYCFAIRHNSPSLTIVVFSIKEKIREVYLRLNNE